MVVGSVIKHNVRRKGGLKGGSFFWLGKVTGGITTVWEQTRNKEMNCAALPDIITYRYFALHVTEHTPSARYLSVCLSVCLCDSSFRRTL